ncbi:MAG: choline dehydrogenase, partial [Segetibacter sp.]|nr:choline dehydrogenase [Segetibacter sp.]
MENEYDAVIIGSGFGGTITALTIAREFYLEWLKDKSKPKRKVLLLERGTWWTTPVGTVADKEVAAYAMLKKQNQPVQFWSSNNSFRGLVDILTRCTHHEGNVRGLYELTGFGMRGLLGLFGKNDGLTVLRASGVGGGSLVYSNITVQPPNLIFNDDRWKPMQTWLTKKDAYYNAARTAIGTGILRALTEWDLTNNPDVASQINNDPVLKKDLTPKVNTGLSQIVTRIAGHNPHFKKEKVVPEGWRIVKNPEGQPLFQLDKEREEKGLKKIQEEKATDPTIIDDERDIKNELWVDRARIFHNGMAQLSKDVNVEYSANDLSINDFDTAPMQVSSPNRPGGNLFDGDGLARNYCERQGRCNVGCLPGARHTLNKQLMNAIYGKVDFKRDEKGELSLDSEGNFVLLDRGGILKDFLFVQALSEVDYINKLDDYDYEVHYWQHAVWSAKKSKRQQKSVLRAKRVIVSAGTLGTNEIMLRSRKKGGIKTLSKQIGFGFSPNGDNFYFLSKTKERVRSTRGPVQSSHAHFNLSDTGKNPGAMQTGDPIFHMIEDLGIPPALASTIGFGQPLFSRLANGQQKLIPTIIAIFNYAVKKGWDILLAPFRNKTVRQDSFMNEDEVSSNYLLVTTTGREQAKAQIKLGGPMDTPLRLDRKDSNGKKELFVDDPVYKDI